jgi:TonB family protein
MAELFKAKQVGLEGFQRIVAIKKILPHLATNSDFVTMFIDEAKLAAQLNHPNIVHIYDLGKKSDAYFIAMEYVEGRDLRSILKECEPLQETVPLKTAVYIARKVCSALHYAHTAKDADGKAMKLVHRDVSPQNILISSAGEVKLVDFGIAKAASKASHTQTGALKGKLLYMSPEQAWGKTLDGRSDIFSVGTVLFEMLTGKKLFYGDSEMSILERVREAKVPDFEPFKELIPQQLEKIIRRSLEKDPDRRYRDARSLEADLEKFSRQMAFVTTAYDTVSFLSNLFPSVYTKEKLEALSREKEEAEAGLQQPQKEAEEKKKVDTVKVVPPPPPPKPVEKPRPVEEKKAAPPPPKPVQKEAPPPPKPAEKKEELFSSVAADEDAGEGKKKMMMIGGIVGGVVVLAIIGFLLFGGKKPAPPAEEKPAVTDTKPADTQPKVPEAPKEITPEVPPPPATAENPADVEKAKTAATTALKSFDDAIKAVEAAGAAEHAPQALESLKKSKGNMDRLFRNAKSIGEFDAISKAAKSGLDSANKSKDDVAALKAQKEKEKADEAARLKAEEDKKKADDAAKAAAQPKKTERGQFVPLPDLLDSERPKVIKRAEPVYTALARQNKVEGTYYVQMSVNEEGKVTAAEVVRGPSPDYGLKDECVKAAMQWQFAPAVKDGVPVKTQMTFGIPFKLK